MNEFEIVSIIAMVGWLILAASAFASYRLSWGKTIQMALIWAAIFGGGAVFAYVFGLKLPN